MARLGVEYQALIQLKPAALSAEQQARLKELRPLLDAATAEFKKALDNIIAAFHNLREERHAELNKRQLDSNDRGLARDLGADVALLLRQAQLTLLHGTSGSASDKADRGDVFRIGKTGGAAFPTDPTHPYVHPYYWAPFILMGNWL